MREVKIVEKELLEARKVLEKIDESDLLNVELTKSKIERLENELELIKRGSRKITKIEGLPKGKYKKPAIKSKVLVNKIKL